MGPSVGAVKIVLFLIRSRYGLSSSSSSATYAPVVPSENTTTTPSSPSSSTLSSRIPSFIDVNLREMEMPDCPELLIWRVQWLATSVLSEHLDAIRTKPSFEGSRLSGACQVSELVDVSIAPADLDGDLLPRNMESGTKNACRKVKVRTTGLQPVQAIEAVCRAAVRWRCGLDLSDRVSNGAL